MVIRFSLVQVKAKSIFFLGAPGHVIRIFHDTHVTSPEYLQIALWTLDLQIHALNSLTSGPRA